MHAIFRHLLTPFSRLHRQVRLRTKLTIPLLFILLVSSGMIGWTFYTQAKQVMISHNLSQEGLILQQYLVKNGAFYPIEKVTKGAIEIPQDIAKRMEAERFGVIHVPVADHIHTLAFTHSPEESYI